MYSLCFTGCAHQCVPFALFCRHKQEHTHPNFAPSCMGALRGEDLLAERGTNSVGCGPRWLMLRSLPKPPHSLQTSCPQWSGAVAPVWVGYGLGVERRVRCRVFRRFEWFLQTGVCVLQCNMNRKVQSRFRFRPFRFCFRLGEERLWRFRFRVSARSCATQPLRLYLCTWPYSLCIPAPWKYASRPHTAFARSVGLDGQRHWKNKRIWEGNFKNSMKAGVWRERHKWKHRTIAIWNIHCRNTSTLICPPRRKCSNSQWEVRPCKLKCILVTNLCNLGNTVLPTRMEEKTQIQCVPHTIGCEIVTPKNPSDKRPKLWFKKIERKFQTISHSWFWKIPVLQRRTLMCLKSEDTVELWEQSCLSDHDVPIAVRFLSE